MKLSGKKLKSADIPVYEHLEVTLKKTTYAQRLEWLEEANEFVRMLERKKNYPALSRRK